jgi:hypothetical protein
MKGKKYNLVFKTPDGEINFEGLMEEIINFIKTNIKHYYHLDIKVSKHMVYNNIHRPESTNKLFRSLCKISSK